MGQDTEKKIDRRVLYTKMFLRESLLELMREKPVDKITPTELCRRAGINRNTFYSHYYAVRDVLKEIEDEFTGQVADSLNSMLSSADIFALLNRVCELIYERRDFCKVLLSANGDVIFLKTVVELYSNRVMSDWEQRGVRLDDASMKMVYDYVVYGSIAIIRAWASDDMKTPPGEIAKLIGSVSVGGISALT